MHVDKKNQKIKVLIWGTASFLFFGMLYGWSIFVVPLENEFSWTRTQISVAYTISLMFYTAGLFFNSVIASKKGARFAGLLGFALAIFGLAASAFVNTLPMLYLIYGVCWGSGIGLCYNSWLIIVISWYPEKKGFATGVLLMGIGLGGMIIGAAVTRILGTSLGWRGAFLIMAGAVFLVSVFAQRYLRFPETTGQTITVAEHTDDGSRTSAQMLKQPAFWMFALWKTVLCGLCQAVIGQQTMIMTDANATVMFAAMTVGIVSIGNGAARVLLGIFSDSFGYIRTFVIISTGITGASLLLWYSYQAKQPYGTFIALILIGMCYGGLIMITSFFLTSAFGAKHLQSNMGVASLINLVGTMSAPVLISVVQESTQSYHPFFAIMACAGVLSFTLIAAIKFFICRARATTQQQAADHEQIQGTISNGRVGKMRRFICCMNKHIKRS